MSVPKVVVDLVERFRRNESAYRSGQYNETQVRREFIDPFFECLGWDVNNRQGYAEAYKEVIHEDSLDVEGAKRAPDYCFRIGGTRKFFLEAKKPSVNVRDDISPAYQLRRYAWTAKLPLSILTDFEEFAVYDGRVKPTPTDKSATARVLFIPYVEYPDRWTEIASRFSKEAILQGAFDQFADTNKGKRGTATVDQAFLAEIESWRDVLARNIALRNPGLDQRGLNDAVQRTIDRIIFLRLCEDRGIEDYGRLSKCGEEKDIYDALKTLFIQADYRYNSGLFHFEPEKGRAGTDQVTLDLNIDDKILKPILRGLYYPDCPYEFSVMPPDILGHVYEQFLGKVIRLTPSHQAKVEEKPEVRKAGGVYYTPSYIVDYIVKHTVGALLEGKAPRDVDGTKKGAPPLRVLDPACGSGSFLIVAYQYLLDWYRDRYAADDPEKYCTGKNPKLRPIAGRDYALTVPERKRILLDHIYGVDIDPQAVEVTKLSLLLKVIEGESAASLGQNRLLFQERALPDLDKNIKCGNSLIGPEYYAGEQTDVFDTEEMMRVNAFDWGTEFPFITNDGGFGAVIGNPPYGFVFSKADLPYLKKNHSTFSSVQDGYVAFIEKSHKLVRDNGRFGFIVPSAWLGGPAFLPLREFLLSVSLSSIILLPFDVFSDAYIDTLIVCTQKIAPDKQHKVMTLEYPKRRKISCIDLSQDKPSLIFQRDWILDEDKKIILGSGMLKVIRRLSQAVPTCFTDVVEMKRGVLFDKSLLTDSRISSNSFPYFEGNVYRYDLQIKTPSWVEYGEKMKEWPKDFKWFEGKRILLRRLVNRKQRLMACIAEDTFITNKNLYSILPKAHERIEYILGVLNSTLLSKVYISKVTQATKDDFPQVTITDLLKLPFKTIDFTSAIEKEHHDRVAFLAQRLLTLNQQQTSATTSHERTLLERQITATDRQIDQLVYALYGLTEEEIALVENTSP